MHEGYDEKELLKEETRLPYSDEITKNAKELSLRETVSIQRLILMGVLKIANDTDKYKNVAECEISHKHGWRIVVKAVPTNTQISTLYDHSKIFASFNDAQEYIDEVKRRCDEQANMSDEEWNKQLIIHKLDMFVCLNYITREQSQYIQDLLFERKDIADIDIRRNISTGNIHFSSGKSRWTKIDLEDTRWN